ncbi:hypothetical protein [Oceanicola sp. 502str15]|uniref:hypothetical protein n=1 Tax=Oceanicola sp. 502str15 TaxID=2696061 RepID=UPI002095839A|nr:hypothetical protein [Oceanicola sp. 502str15]MCO6382955.1 hypothetical protein [Oceanicola sp. 502str15]
MADYLFPDQGGEKWHIESELVWGIPPFAVMEIDFTNNRGTCRWGKTCHGKISNVRVNAARTQFTAAFSISHAHRDQKFGVLAGTMTVGIKSNKGRIWMKIAGMSDWRDNTTFEAQRVEGARQYSPIGGKNFDVELTVGNAAKAAAVATFGNLYARDRDRQTEVMYPLIVAGVGGTVGATLYSATTFANVKLKTPCHDWSYADVSIFTGLGVNFIAGFNSTGLELRMKGARLFLAETSGFGIGADISATYMTGQIGKLGPRSAEKPY